MSTADNLSILFVDDQPVLLKMLCNVIEHRAPNWDIRTAQSGPEALDTLKNNPCDVVVSDMNMPGMDGMTLLQEVKQVHPGLLRFILSGQTSQCEILNSVGVAHQLLNKPIQIEELVESLELSHSLYQKIRDPELQNMIASVGTLPTPRDVYFRVSKMLNDPDVDLSEIADAVSEDAAISAKILQLVNTAGLTRGSRIDNIYTAVSTLGIQNVRSLILIVGLAADQNEELDRFLSIDGYSKQALEVAQLCRWFARQSGLRRDDQEALFTSGLLHSVGKVVLIGHHRKYYEQNQFKENPFSSSLCIGDSDVEKHGHALVGASLLALWGLPARVINGVAYHRCPESAPDSLSNHALLVHLAEGMVNYRHSENRPNSIFESDFINNELVDELAMQGEIQTWMDEWDFHNM